MCGLTIETNSCRGLSGMLCCLFCRLYWKPSRVLQQVRYSSCCTHPDKVIKYGSRYAYIEIGQIFVSRLKFGPDDQKHSMVRLTSLLPKVPGDYSRIVVWIHLLSKGMNFHISLKALTRLSMTPLLEWVSVQHPDRLILILAFFQALTWGAYATGLLLSLFAYLYLRCQHTILFISVTSNTWFIL